MLQNTSYVFFLKRNKTKQNDYKKKRKASHGKSQTRDLRHVRETRYPLHQATIAKTAWQINDVYLTFLCPQDKIIQDGTENPDVSRNEYHKRSPLSTTRNPTEYHRDPKIMCCVLLTSNAIKFRYNVHSDWLKSMLYQSIKQGAICESHHVMVFKTKVSHFRYKNTQMERESSKEYSFFFLWTRKAFGCKIVLQVIQQCFLQSGAQNVLFKIHSRQQSFWRLFSHIHFLLF